MTGIRYATSKHNTWLTAVRLGKVVDDTFRVSVYRDGVPETFTVHEGRLSQILDQFHNDGFHVEMKVQGRLFEAWMKNA